MIREDEYEDGDIIAFGDDKDKPTIGIFNYYYDLSKKRDSHNDYCQLECNGTVWHHEVGYLSNSRLATEEEKQKLFDALAKKGKRWNAEKKAIEDVKEENKCEFKRGQAVLVRDNHDSFWKLALFIDYNRNTAYSYLTTSGGKKLCIDYDSHRDLLYQFDNPE